jgi:hypothetical protein
MRKAHTKPEPSTEATSPFTVERLVVIDAESCDPIPSGEPSRGTEDTADDGGMDSTQLDGEFSPPWAAGPPSDRVSCSWTIPTLDVIVVNCALSIYSVTPSLHTLRPSRTATTVKEGRNDFDDLLAPQ